MSEAVELPIYQAMSTCRAVRRLRPDPVPDEVLDRVFRAATWAPSGGNRQPWDIVAVRDRETKSALGDLYASRWTAYAEAARKRAEGVPEPHRGSTLRSLDAGDYMASHFAEIPVIAVFCFDPRPLAITDRELDRASVVGGASIYPAVQNLLLACRNEGLGCVLTTLLCFDEPKVKELLAIPDALATAAHIPIGYPVGRGHGPISRRDPESVVHWDRW